MAEQDLLKTPLNAPNQEADLNIATGFEGWGTPAIAPAALEPVESAQVIPDFFPLKKPVEKPSTVVEQKLSTVGKAVQTKALNFEQHREQLRLARLQQIEDNNLDTAWASDVDSLSGGTINVAANLTAGAARVAGNIVQFVPSGIIDDYADTAEIRDILSKEAELKQQLEISVNPEEQKALSSRIEYISNWLEGNYEETFGKDTRLMTRRQMTEKTAGNIDTARAVYDLVESVDKYFDSKVNKTLSNAITEEVKPYAAESAAQFKNGDYVGGLGTLAEGIFTVAINNPQGAVEMFSNSLPQMIAVASKLPISAATVVATYGEHVDTMAKDFEESYGYRATDNDREAIQLGAAAATMFDFFSDKVALKGMDLIPTKMINKVTEGMVKLAPKGTKTVTKYTTKFAGNVGGLAIQPVQEFISGAGTELSEQVGVNKGVTDLETILEQGMIEAIAVSPVQATVMTARTLKAGRSLVSKATKKAADIGSVLQEQSDLATTILQSTVTDPSVLAEAEGTATPEGIASPAGVEPTPIIRFIQFTANNSFKDLPLEEKTVEATENYMNEFNELFQEATDFHEKNPGSANEIELNFLKHAQATNQAAGTLYNELTKADTDNAGTTLRDVAAKLAKATAQDLSDPAKVVELKDTFLGSIDLRNVAKEDSPTAAELKSAKEKLQLTVEESIEIDTYIELREAFENVSVEIKSADSDKMGIAFHINEVVRAVKGKNIKAAEGALGFYAKWVAYQGFKVKKFKEIKEHNALPFAERRAAEVPVGVTAIDGVTNNGSINRFTLTYDTFAFDRHDKAKVQEWFFNDKSGASSKLIEVMETDQVALESALTALETLLAGGVDTTNSNNTTSTEAAPASTTQVPVVPETPPSSTTPAVVDEKPQINVIDIPAELAARDAARAAAREEITEAPAENETKTVYDEFVAALRATKDGKLSMDVAQVVFKVSSIRKSFVVPVQLKQKDVDNTRQGTEVVDRVTGDKFYLVNAKGVEDYGSYSRFIAFDSDGVLVDENLGGNFRKAVANLALGGNATQTVWTLLEKVVEAKEAAETKKTAEIAPAVPAVEEATTVEESTDVDPLAFTAEDIALADDTSPESISNQAEIDQQVNAFNESEIEAQKEAVYSTQEELFGNAELDLNHVGTLVDGGVSSEAAFVENENGEQVDLQGGNTLADNFNPKGTAAAAQKAETLAANKKAVVEAESKVYKAEDKLTGEKNSRTINPEGGVAAANNRLEALKQDVIDAKAELKAAKAKIETKTEPSIAVVEEVPFTPASEDIDFNNILDDFLNELNSNAESVQDTTVPDVIKGSYLKRIRNFFGSISEQLSNLNLSETEITVLNELARLNKKLTGNLSTVIEALKDPNKPFTITSRYAVNGTKDTLMQNPMLMLAKAITVGTKAKRAYFDPNIVSMMNLAGINWIATQGLSTLYNNSDSIRRILRAESNVAKTDTETVDKLRLAGTMYTTLVESLGKEIYKQLSIELKENTPVLLKERLIVALGETAVENLISAGLLEKSEFTADELFENGSKAKVFFIRIPTKSENSLEPSDRVSSILKLNKGKNSAAYASLSKKISGIEIRAKFPSFKAKVLKESATYLKSLRLLPKRVRDDINIANAVKWKIKPDMEYLLQPENREEATEFFMLMQGYEPNVQDRPLALQAGDIGRNLGIMSEIEGVFDFYDIYLENGKKGFNFSYNTGENARHTVNESGFSYQSSKLVRHIITAQNSKQKKDGFRVTVPLNLKNSLILDNFKYAIVQALSTEVSIDKDTHENILKEFDVLANDPIISVASQKVFDKKYLDRSIVDVTEVLRVGDRGAHGFDGLTALGNYFNAINNGNTQFSTDITIETDAITSGVMLTLLNFGALDTKSIEKLNSGGIFLDNNNTLTEHRRTNKEDVYTMLVEPWKIQAELRSKNKPKYAAILDLVKIDRNTAKPVIMQGSYMANFSSLVNNFVSGTIDGQINALYQRLYEGTTLQKVAIYTSLGALVHPNNAVAAKALSDKLYVEDSLLNTQELPANVIKVYTKALEEIYGEALTDILSKDEGMRPNATAINQMVNMVSWYYRFKINKAIEALGGYETLTEEGLLKVYADPALAELVPYLPTPDSIAREEGLNGLITRNLRDSSNDSNVVKQELNPSKEGAAKTASARSSRKVSDNASARSFVISVQSIDDAIIRAVMRQMKVMSAFDAIYASLGTINEGSKIYNENVLEVSKNFSIFEETHTNYTKSMTALKRSGEFNELIQFMYDDTNGFDEKNQLVEKYLYDMSQGFNLSDIDNPKSAESLQLARTIFNKMQKDLNERNETIKRNRRELFRRIRTVDHMGMPGTHVNVNNNIGEQANLPGVDAATEEQKASANKKPTKKKTDKLPQSLFGYIAQLGGITRNDVEWLDNEIVTAGAQAGNKNVFVKNGATLSQVREDTLGVYHNIADDNEFSEYLKTEFDINSGMPSSVFDLTYPLDSLEEVQVLKDASIDAEYLFEQEQEKKLQIEEDKTTFLNEDQDSTLGSINNNDDLTGYTPLAGGLRANSLQQVFDTIGSNTSNGINSTSHINHLKGILSRVIAQVMVPADKLELFVRTQGDTSYGKQVANKVYINIGASLPKNLVNPSAKESYVHELVHVVTRAALSDPKSNGIVRKLNKIMDETVALLNKKYNGEAWKVFLKRDAQGNPIYAISQLEEEKAAKEAFDYIFNNSMMAETTTYDADSKKGQVVKTRAGLHEFLAYALTNESLNSALADEKISLYSPVKDAANIFAKLLAILENVLTWAENTLNKARKKTGADKANNTAELLEQMVHELTVTTDEYQIRSRRIMETLTNLNTKTSALARAKIGVPFAIKAEKARYKALALGNRYTYISLTFAGFINPVTRSKLRDELDDLRAAMRLSKRNFITELYREIAGNITMDQRTMERKLLDSRQTLDAQRDEYTNAIANSISQGYTDKLSNEEAEATTRVLIESDFAVLVDDWNNIDLLDLAAYLTDTAKRDKAIKDVRKRLSQYGAIGNFYIGQALSLGSFMAQGFVTVEGTRLNASLIARADDLANIPSIKIPRELDQVEALIDRLATLQAIGLNTKDARNTAAAVMVREHGIDANKNGAINMLTLIDEHKKQSLIRNFENNKTLQMKGYSKEVFDSSISIVVARLDEEQAYADLGYKLVDTTITDTDDTGVPSVMGIYQNRTGGHTTRQKFIMSVTNTQMQGQSILKRAASESGKEEYLKAQKKVSDIKAKNKLEARKLLRNPDYVSIKKNILIPVTNELGKVTDYRYVMGKAKKARLLNQKADAVMILSKMYGAILDKEETPRINNDVIKELYSQYLASAGRQTRDFVEISLEAVDEKGKPNQEYREIYQILPDSTKRYIKELTGDDKIMVKAEFVDIVFGRKKIRLPGNDTMQKIYGVWFEFVAGAKKNIVIRWPATLIGNVISNTAFGVMYGVPIEFMFKKQAEGAIKLNNYIQDIKQLNNLKLELVVAKKTNALADIKSIEAKIAKVQTNINTSPILPLIKGGAFQTIVEDIDVLKDPYSYASKVSDFFGEIQGKGGKGGATVGGARQVYKYAYMSEDTAVFKALMKTTQFSDFAARYAKYEYMTKFQKMGEVEAMEIVMEDFINYETPTNKYVQFANDSGLQMFTKYGFRILRVIASLMQGRPLNAISFLLINDLLTTDIPSPFDVTPFDNNNGLTSLILAGTTPSGIKLVDDTIDIVTPN